ncbi:MAG: c-type cytochrome biogenesis protein CcsB [bacterium]
MTSSFLLSLATFSYVIVMVLFFTYVFFQNKTFRSVIRAATTAGLAFNLAGWILRWIESARLGYGHVPLSNFYEALITISWCIVLVYIIIQWRYKTDILGVFIFPIVSLAMAYASLSPSVRDSIQPLMPALQSNWLTYHVLTCLLGYAAFTVAFGSSIAYLIKQGEKGKSKGGIPDLLPHADLLEEVIYKANAIGFLLLGIGIVTGSVWANVAWGSYWSWDPKETWSLITWIVYAVFLHARLTKGWKGKRMAVLSIIGFIAVLFTFLGVNFLLSGLHSYAS